MRLEAISLENYGAFAARSLELGEKPGLTIVYGPNEAGKSTFLAAIGDFLFTIPNNSPRGGMFGYDAMRIGATLRTRDGRRLVLRRRKGRGITLTDEAGAPVDDTVLAQLLGSTTRERFASLFGLDHQALREGGEHLLSAAGDIGRLIVEAGGGLRTLMARLDDIDAEAGKLFSNRRSGDRVFYQALDAFTNAERQGKAGLLTRDAYEKQRKAYAAADERLTALRETQRTLAGRTSALQRAIRVSPLLVEHGGLEEQLKTFENVGDLGEGFSDQVTAALAAKDTAARLINEVMERHQDLAGRLDALLVDARLTAIEADVLDFVERLAIVRTQRADRPNRIVELAQNDERLSSLRRRLQLGPDEDLAPRLPAADVLEKVQQLASDALTRAPTLANAKIRSAELDDEAGRHRESIARAELLGQDRPFGIRAADLAPLPSQSAALEVRRRQSRTAADEAAARCKALGFDTLAALSALPCPSPGALQSEINAQAALEEERGKCTMEIARATAEALSAEAEIDRLQAAGEVPTDVLLAASRASREDAWAPIRAAHLGQAPLPSLPQGDSEVVAFETAMGRVDDIAERRGSEAQRIAFLASAEQLKGLASGRAQAGRNAELAAAAALTKLTQAFAKALPEFTARTPDLTVASLFLEERRQTLDDGRAALAMGQEVERLTAELEPLLEMLKTAESRATIQPPVASSLGARATAAMAAIVAHDEAYREHQASVTAIVELEPRLATEIRKAKELEADEARWTLAWAPAVTALGARADIAVQSAAELVTLWASAEGIISARAQTQRRLDRMDEDAAELGRLTTSAGAAVGLALPNDEVVAAQMLEARWRENEAVRIQRAGLEPGLPPLAASLAARQRDVVAAEARLHDLATHAGVADTDAAALQGLAARHAARSQTLAALAHLEATLTTAGDALGIDTLREECGARSIDALRADLAAVSAEELAVGADYDDAIRSAQTLKAELDGYEDDASLSRASVEREAATARMHAAIERYLELTLARSLVTQAIAKVRAEQQDPLIRRAGELFAVATTGEFTGLEADIDHNGQPVIVGVRALGGRAHIDIMSDGTRDQLFLAFRLASIENYCKATEPLPFIADDILVHFDDPRSAATLELLAEFAKTSQVILFTHHEEVRRAAENLVRLGRASLIDLGWT